MRERDAEEESERGLEVVSGRGGIHLYIFDVVYIPLLSRPSLPLYNRLFLRLPLVWSEPDTLVLRAFARARAVERGEFRFFGPFIFFRPGLQGCPNDGLTTMADPAYCFSRVRLN